MIEDLGISWGQKYRFEKLVEKAKNNVQTDIENETEYAETDHTNKLGLSWAKLSSSWDRALLQL